MREPRPEDAGPLVLVTPPPTPNGRLHIGHVAGPYLRADLLARLVRRTGQRTVHHVSHLDTYQTYVPKKARQLGRDVTEFMAEMRTGLVADFRSYDVHHDLLVDNEDAAYLRYLDGATAHLAALLPLRQEPAVVCAECDVVLVESYLSGFCRRCLHDAFQNVCENCCLPQTHQLLLRPTCATCGSEKHRSDAEQPEQWIEVPASEVDRVVALMSARHGGNRRVEGLFDALGAHRIALSYATDYGVRPTGATGVLNPWVEIYLAHLYAVMTVCSVDPAAPFPQALAALRAVHPAPEVVPFFGVDNTYYYAFLFPWLSLRLGLDVMVPTVVRPSFFLQLNDAKISSSRNNVRWAAELLDEGPVPQLRTNLAVSCPEFAARNYAPAAPRAAAAPEVGATGRRPSYRSPAVDAVNARLAELSDPAAFTVEGVLDVLAKTSTLAEALRRRGDLDEAAVLAGLTRSLADDLALA